MTTDSTMARRSALLLALAAGCTGPTNLEARPSGARLVFDEARGELLATDGDRGAITPLPVGGIEGGGEAPTDIPVGVDPARAVLSNEELFVSLRAEKAVAVLVRDATGWATQRRIPVGAEPIGLAVDRPAGFLYVAASLAGEVQEIALASGEITRRFAIPGQPRSIAIPPAGGALYVGSTLGGRVHRVELSSGAISLIEIPTLLGHVFPRPLTLRITGDIAIDPTGTRLTVPIALFDAAQSLDGPQVAREVTSGAYYGGTVEQPRVMPGLADLPLDPATGEPDGPVTITPLFIDPLVRGQPTAIAYPATSDALWIAFEGMASVVSVPADPTFRVTAGHPNFQRLSAGAYGDGLASIGGRGVASASTLARVVHRYELDANNDVHTIEVGQLLPSPLSSEIQLGRQLFFRSDDASMGQNGLTCASCHAEGRTDGISWQFERGPRQTPSLAERVSEHTPLRWGGDRSSVAEDAAITVGLMGGMGIDDASAQAIQAYVDDIRGVDLPLHGVTDAVVTRGRRAFEQAGCAGCHAGEILTDRRPHALRGRTQVQTPSLTGVAATPPYLFDGSLATLADVVDAASDQRHGDADRLSSDDREALVRYLESL